MQKRWSFRRISRRTFLQAGVASGVALMMKSVQIEVENTGQRTGDEVVQLYLQDVEASLSVPQLQLQGFTRIRLEPGEKQVVHFMLSPRRCHLSMKMENGC